VASIFDDMDAVVAGTFGGGEAAIITPRAREQYTSGAVDTDRPENIIHGVFSAGPASEGIAGASAQERAGISAFGSEAAEFWITAIEIAAIHFPIRRGDRLSLPERDGNPTFTIAAIQITDQGDRNLILTREGGA